ncbi:hypothetical protein ACTOV4_00570 [Brucella sp. C7-11G]
MNVYVCTDHDSHWPVGVATVIVAKSLDAAADLLQEALKADGLNPAKPFTLEHLDTTIPTARILCNGEY